MSESHEVMFFTDGRHTSTYLYEPPMGVRQYLEPIDEVVDLGIDTIVYGVGDGSVLHYATEAGERWGHNIDLVDTAIWYRAGMNLASAIERGIDLLALICKHAQGYGFQFIPSFLVPVTHTPRQRVTNARLGDFVMDHPERQVGPEPDVAEAKYDRPNRLSFVYPEVRENRLAVIRELVARYPTDGVDVNLVSGIMPLIARRDVPEHTQTITDWIADVRSACQEAAADQGRAKRLVVRVPCTLSGCLVMGIDVERWIKDGLVDTVVAMPAVGGYENDTARLREIVAAAEGTGVTVVAGVLSQGQHYTREVANATGSNAYAAGARGLFFVTYYPSPGRYPYDDAALGRLRLMGRPELLAHKDKSFRLGPTADPDPGFPLGEKGQLPAYPTPGQTGPEITVEVSDDLEAKAELGELWRCELRVMLQNMVHHDRVRLVWNGAEVPEETIRLADWTYHIRPRAEHAVLGYRLHVDLKAGRLPKQGTNTVRVDVLEKDEHLIHPISISEVEISVEYLPHDHGIRDDERWPGYES